VKRCAVGEGYGATASLSTSESKMTTGELASRSALKIFLESVSFSLRSKCNGDLDMPRPVFCGVSAAACVMFLDAPSEIACEADVANCVVRITYKEVDIKEARHPASGSL